MNIVRVAALAVVLAIVERGDRFWIRVVTGEDGVVTCLDPRIGNIYTAAHYDAALEDLRHLARAHPCNWEYPYIIAGECGDGETLFVEVIEYTLDTDLTMRKATSSRYPNGPTVNPAPPTAHRTSTRRKTWRARYDRQMWLLR